MPRMPFRRPGCAGGRSTRPRFADAKAWLSTTASRLCLDKLKSGQSRREVYAGPWLPEPVVTDQPIDHESISMAFLVLLERLNPAERAAYLLHQVFDYPHREVAEILGLTEGQRDRCSTVPRSMSMPAGHALPLPRPRTREC